MDARLASIGRMIEAFALWAQVLDAHRASPFGDLRLTRSQVEALFLIAHAGVPMTPGRLAEALNVTPGAVTQLVAGLTAEGLVEQARDPEDARRRVLALAPASQEKVDRFERDLVQRLAERFDALDETELDTLATLLAKTRSTR